MEDADLATDQELVDTLAGRPDYRMPRTISGGSLNDYVLTEDGLFWTHSVNNDVVRDAIAARPFLVKRRLRDDRGNSQYVVAMMYDDGEVTELTMPAGVLMDARKLSGAFPEAVVASTYASQCVKYVQQCLMENRHWLVAYGERVATALGWPQNGTAYFVSGPGQPVPVEDVKNTGKWLEGHRSHGSFDESLALVESVADRPLMQMMVNASLAAPMLRVLGAENFAVDLTGRTTGGKTTALRLAASMWGEPTAQGILLSWKDSPTSLEQNMSVLHGMPVFIDETQHAKEGVVADTVYGLSQGRSKGRSKRDGSGQQDVTSFQTIGLITGEHSSVTAASNSGGVSPRVLSATGVPAASKAQADAVKNASMKHFGHLGPAFVEELVKMDHVALRDRYAELCTQLAERCTVAVAARRADSVAVLALTNELAAEIGLVPRLGDEVWEWLVEGGDVVTEEEDNRPLQALRLVLSWAVRNKHLFLGAPGTDADRAPTQGWVGRWEMGRESYVSFAPDKLDRLLLDLKQDAQRVRLDWRDEGWIKRPKGKGGKPGTATTHPLRFNGSSDRHVIITNLEPITEDVTETGEGSGAVGPGAYDGFTQALTARANGN